MRKIDHHDPGPVAQMILEKTKIQGPVPPGIGRPGNDLRPDAPGHFPQRLVTRNMNNDLVARLQGGIHEIEDGLFGPGMDQDLLWMERLVEGGDLFPEFRAALGFGVAKPERGEAIPGARFQLEQVLHRKAFTVGGAQQMWRREFMPGKIAFELKRCEFHVLPQKRFNSICRGEPCVRPGYVRPGYVRLGCVRPIGNEPPWISAS